jgi:hypothetical protein
MLSFMLGTNGLLPRVRVKDSSNIDKSSTKLVSSFDPTGHVSCLCLWVDWLRFGVS